MHMPRLGGDSGVADARPRSVPTTPEPPCHPSILMTGTDLTSRAQRTDDVAAALAVALGARLHLVHVIEPQRLEAMSSSERERARERAELALAEEVARLAAARRELHVTDELTIGAPALQLARAAELLDATMIVVAAIATPSSIFRIGGTAERLAQASRIPVLLVRDPARLLRWLDGERLGIAALVSDDVASSRTIEWLRWLAEIAPCSTAVLHAYRIDEAVRRHGLLARPRAATDPELEGYLRRDLAARVALHPGRDQIAVHPVLAVGRLAEHLLATPAAHDAGLIIVGNRRAAGQARLSSVTRGVIELAGGSVLVVPVESAAVGPTPWPRLRRVLAGTDFSPYAAHALRHAYGLVALGGGEVVLAHVMSKTTSDRREEITAQLRALMQEAAGVTTSVVTTWHDDAAAGILEIAEPGSIDCIVVASHSRGEVQPARLGSVAQRVVQHSTLPVLVVHPAAG
jgi:nucleotide-binding universal stress UspA family protein